MKNEIRRETLLKRELHHAGRGHQNCLEIMDLLSRLPEFAGAKNILLYSSKGSEVHTSDILRSALSLGKKVALPVTKKEGKELELYWVDSPDELVLGRYGIMEPKAEPEKLARPSEINLAIVPGVSFDLRGHRLGYGMGYYDSLLPKLSCPKIALAYEIQLVPRVPNEPHDVAVDKIITEKRVIDCRSGEGALAGKEKIPRAGKDAALPLKKFRVAVLASGRGSDFQSLIDAKSRGELDVEIVGLITDNPFAPAVARAKENGIPAFPIAHRDREELDLELRRQLDALSPDLVVLAGYMKIIRDRELLSAYAGRIINIHPSLLPKYPGAHAQQDAFEAGEKVSGYTVHYVDASLDGGQIVYQEKVDISNCSTWQEAALRILEREHEGLPRVVGMFARGEIPPMRKK